MAHDEVQSITTGSQNSVWYYFIKYLHRDLKLLNKVLSVDVHLSEAVIFGKHLCDLIVEV
jgi:hypothetical protein